MKNCIYCGKELTNSQIKKNTTNVVQEVVLKN